MRTVRLWIAATGRGTAEMGRLAEYPLPYDAYASTLVLRKPDRFGDRSIQSGLIRTECNRHASCQINYSQSRNRSHRRFSALITIEQDEL